MRTYYIFKINKYFTFCYKKWPYRLYKILEEVYYSNNYDNKLSYKYYKQVAINFNKFSLNEYIYTRNVNKDGYHRDNNLHIYKTNSFSKLSIYGTCLILKTNDMNSIFLNDIYYSEENIFICDFINNDYFWLDSLIIDRQKEELLV